MDTSAIVFLATAGTTAAIHSLVPDHWLPFVLMGKSRAWPISKTLTLAALAGLLHVCLAVLLGVLSYLLARQGARTAAQNLREMLEILSPLLLSCFGFLYGVHSWRRENRHHPPAGAPRQGAGPDDSHHHHGHLLERWFGGGGSGWSLVVVIGVSPCALALPVLLAGAAKLGLTGVVLVAGGFGTVTMVTTLGVTLLGSISARKIDFPFLTRYGDLITGILIGSTGAFLFVWELSR